jgi:hypothetical protein
VVGSLLAAVVGEVWLRGAKALHPGIGCDGENCGANPIEGIRFSKRGQDWDLCTTCYGRCCSTEAEHAHYKRLERACDRGLISAQVAAARLLSKLMPHLHNLHPPHDGHGGECRVRLRVGAPAPPGRVQGSDVAVLEGAPPHASPRCCGAPRRRRANPVPLQPLQPS